MAYCTKQQLIDQYGEPMLVAASDRAEVATGTIDDVAVARAIADGDAMIDGFLAVRYALPLASVPSLVTALSLTIAIYKLHGQVATEKLNTDYQDARKTLQQIAQGLMKLDIAGAEPAGSGAAGVRITDRDRPFTAGTMKGYI